MEEIVQIDFDFTYVRNMDLAIYLIWLRSFRCRRAGRNVKDPSDVCFMFETTNDLTVEIGKYENYDVNVNLRMLNDAREQNDIEMLMVE